MPSKENRRYWPTRWQIPLGPPEGRRCEGRDGIRLLLDHLAIRRLHREPGAVGEDLLDLEKIIQPMVAELSSHAALLVPPPDALHRLGVVFPDPDSAGADPPGHPHGARVIRAPDPGH